MDNIPITRHGYGVLKKELETLKSKDRPVNIKAIEEARAHGDLSENAEFDAAKERQAFIEGRIRELGYKLGNAQIIDPDDILKDKVVFGCSVILENIDTEEKVRYQLVGPDESNISDGKISVTSPLGKAMLGKKPGEEVVLNAPAGKRTYELVDIV